MSSFKKRIAKNTPEPPSGTRVSSYNGAVLLSTGVASVDDILGGGSPLGSILLVEEDRDTSYTKLLLKYWIAQGLCCPGQRVVVVSNGLDQPPEDIVSKLPFSEDATAATHQQADAASAGGSTADAGTDDEDETLAAGARESMKIAFRYESMKKFETSVGKRSTTQGSEAVYCSTYNLTKSLALTEDHRSRLHCIDATAQESSLEGLLEAIKNAILARPPSTALRIAIQSIGTLAWGDADSPAIYRFFLSLRTLLREYAAGTAAMITLPGYLLRAMKKGAAHLRRIEWLCDSVLELESFAGSPSLQAVFPAYSGLLHIHRLPTPNSLLPPAAKLSVLRGLAPGSNSTSSGAGGMDNNLGFKLKRRRGFVVETLHLDEGGGTSERRTTPSASAAVVEAEEPPKGSEDQEKPTRKKLEKRRIRFVDDPSENPSGILGASKPAGLVSGLQRDKPELYEF